MTESTTPPKPDTLPELPPVSPENEEQTNPVPVPDNPTANTLDFEDNNNPDTQLRGDRSTEQGQKIDDILLERGLTKSDAVGIHLQTSGAAFNKSDQDAFRIQVNTAAQMLKKNTEGPAQPTNLPEQDSNSTILPEE